MKLIYPHITAGYLGYKNTDATLNSEFFSEYLNYNEKNNITIFPQRVLKKDFFKEIMMFEGKNVAQKILDFGLNLREKLKNILLNGDEPRYVINLLNILLRYGLFEEIINLKVKKLNNSFDSSDLLEIELLQEISRQRLRGSMNTTASLNNLKKLALKALNDNTLSERIQLLVLNYVIVISYRFGPPSLDYQTYSKKCYEKIIDLLEHQNNIGFSLSIRRSVAYRGLAMIKEIDLSLQNDFLLKAEDSARNVIPNGKLESIVAKENLYTCLQTLCKMNMNFDKFDAANKNLLEMIQLDPLDSTGYGEMGFLHYSQENYEEALHYFNQGANLGPPAVGMHRYYQAKCLQALGQNDDAVKILLRVLEIDKEAVSPVLDLYEYSLNIKQISEAKKYAALILTNAIYKEQLDQDEIIMLENTLNV